MKVITGKTSKVIADVLAQIDQKEFARTQKRLMLAAKIDEAMRRKGYNQRQFAKLMGNPLRSFLNGFLENAISLLTL